MAARPPPERSRFMVTPVRLPARKPHISCYEATPAVEGAKAPSLLHLPRDAGKIPTSPPPPAASLSNAILRNGGSAGRLPCVQAAVVAAVAVCTRSAG